MARAVVCLGILAVGLCLSTPASAGSAENGYQLVKLQIDPRMVMMNDGSPSGPAQQMPNGMAERNTGAPLEQMDDDPDAPAGDDPFADNAVETDTVYSI